MKAVNNYNEYTSQLTGIFDIERYSKDKKTIADTLCANVLDKVNNMFVWHNLPDTIPQKWLELMLTRAGYTVITEVPNKGLYAFTGGLGGEFNAYYQPTVCIISNPYLKFEKSVEIEDDKDGVLISNDTLRRGLLPLIGKYAGLLTENTITMRIADIMTRATAILSGSDIDTVTSIEEYLKQLEDGTLGVIQESTFLDNDFKVQGQETQAHTQLTDLIEVEQYLKASLWNELGLQANYNMKRESLTSSEAQMNDDATKPFIENMLEMRQDAAKRLNARYGLNISVEFAGVWAQKQAEDAAEIESEGNSPEEKEPESTAVLTEEETIASEADPEELPADGAESEEPEVPVEADNSIQDDTSKEPIEPTDIDININITTGDDSTITSNPEEPEVPVEADNGDDEDSKLSDN